MKILVVGSGQAGISVLRELRKRSSHLDLALVTENDGDFYAKPTISNAFKQQKTAAQLVAQTADQLAGTLQLTLHPHTTALAIDRAQRQLVSAAGRLDYDALVLATGAVPVMPSTALMDFYAQIVGEQGIAEAAIHTVNDLWQYARLRHALGDGDTKRPVVILGSGLVGCELANDLATGGYAVTLLSPDDYPLQRLLPPTVGHALHAALANLGVSFGPHWPPNHQNAVVVAALGLLPRRELAAAAHLATDPAIVADAYGRTADPAIYALGDGARIDGHWLPYIAPITHAAKALAATLTGSPTAIRYPAMPVVIKTPALPLVVAPPVGAGEWRWVAAEPGHWHGEWRNGAGELSGFVLGGDGVKQRQALTAQLVRWL